MDLKEKNKFKCPYECNKIYKTSRWFIGHLILKHDSSWKVFFVILTLLGLGLAIFAPVYDDYVQYYWDKILGKDLEFYLSVNSVYLLDNKQKITITNLNEAINFLNKQVTVGLIPPSHNNQPPPFMWTLEDNKLAQSACLFGSYKNVNKFFEPKELEPEMREIYPEGSYGLGLVTPTREIVEKLENCEDCLGQLFYGVNLGERDIDTINFEICYDEEYFIEETGFEKTSNHCFRVKRENLIEEETLLGYVIIKDYNEPVYYSLWEDRFYPTVYGKYESQGIDTEVSEDSLAQVISAVVPNCKFS